MATVEERIVKMRFDYRGFGEGVKNVLGKIRNLNKGLNFKSLNPFGNLQREANRFNLSSVASSVDTISSKFSNLSIIGITALTNIVNKAVDAGMRISKSLTIDPITQGFQEYETNLNSIQTILANTSKEGTTLKDVNGALGELNEYSDKTIYNFSEMARNIGTFTAAGVDLDTSTESIKGIANLAAVSGSNSQQASTAMYQLSQALSSGRVSLQDWNSVVNAGMGGQVFQDALIQSAEAMGINAQAQVDAAGSFRESISAAGGGETWLSADVLTQTLKTFTGDLDEAQLKTMGYNDAQIKSIIEMGKTATDAATKVKTVTQLMDTLKEAVGSGWMKTFELILGDFEEAREMFTNVSNALGDIIGKSADSRNKLVSDWKKLGGRDSAINAVANAFKGLMSVVTPIREAFSDVFPAATGEELFKITQTIEKFTSGLILGDEASENLRRTARGLFAILGVGWEVLKHVGSAIFELAAYAADGSGKFLKFTGDVGQFFASVFEDIYNYDVLGDFFDKFVNGGKAVIDFVKDFASSITDGLNIDVTAWNDGYLIVLGRFMEVLRGVGNEFKEVFDFIAGFGRVVGNAFKEVSDFIVGFGRGLASVITDIGSVGSAIVDRWSPIAGIAEAGRAAFEKFFDILGRVGEIVGDVMSTIGEVLEKVWDALISAFTSGNWSLLLDTINTTMLATIALALKGFLDNFSLTGQKAESEGNIFTNAIDSIKDSLEQLTETFTVMQANLKAGTLMKLAIAIGVMTVSLVALSLIDSDKLTKAITAMSFMFAQLLISMQILSIISSSGGFLKMPFIAASMILMAAAVDVLTIAVTALADLSWEELAKGIGSVTVLLFGLAGAAALLSKSSKGLATGSVGLLIMAAAIKVLADVVISFSSTSWEDMAKGLTGVGALLVSLILFTRFASLNKMGMAQSAGILLLAAAIKVLASAAQDFGSMNMEQILKGIGSISALLVAISLFVNNTANTVKVLATGAALVVLAGALKILADVMADMAQLSWEEIAKGLVAMAGGLVIMGAALNLIPATSIVTAGAITVVAGALTILAKAMEITGKMTWTEIGKALVTLAASLLIIGAALAFMTGTLLGSAALVTAAGALTILTPVLITMGSMSWGMITKGLVALGGALLIAAVGGLALTPATPALIGFAAAVAIFGAGILLVGVGVLAFSTGIGILVAAIIALGAAIGAVFKAAIDILKSVMDAIGRVLDFIYELAMQAGPKVGSAISDMMGAFLQAIRDNAPMVGEAFSALLSQILRFAKEKVPEVVKTFLGMIKSFIRDLKNNVPTIVGDFLQMLLDILRKIRNETPKIVQAFFDIILGFLKKLRENIPKILDEFLGMMNDILEIINDHLPELIDSGVDILMSILEGIENRLPEIQEKTTDIIVEFLNGIERDMPRIIEAGEGVTKAFVRGVVGAIGGVAGDLGKAGGSMAKNLATGMTDGLASKTKSVGRAGWNLGMSAVTGIANAIDSRSPSKKAIKLGGFTSEGFGLGISRLAGWVRSKSEHVGEEALDGLKTSMSEAAKAVPDTMNFNPSIKPVVDLSNVRKSASEIDKAFKKRPILDSDISYAKAHKIHSERITMPKTSTTSEDAQKPIVNYNYEQNNYSPKSLSTAEIYRRTNNQLSIMKG